MGKLIIVFALFITFFASGKKNAKIMLSERFLNSIDSGYTCLNQGKHYDAIIHLNKIIKIDESNKRKNTQKSAIIYALLGDAWKVLSNYKKSISYYTAALRII